MPAIRTLRRRPPIETIWWNLPDAPKTMVGFVPILPGTRKFDQTAEALREQASQAEREGKKTAKYIRYRRDYYANYLSLAEAIERDQFVRRGGYFKPMQGPLAFYAEYVCKSRCKPLHMPGYSPADLDNFDKTFIDALGLASRCAPDYGHEEFVYLSNTVDDRHIKLGISTKRTPRPKEMLGVWYALKSIHYQANLIEVHRELAELVKQAQAEETEEQRTFNELNLCIARYDGARFLEGSQEFPLSNLLDPTLPIDNHTANQSITEDIFHSLAG